MSKILHLTLKKKWFDMILSGEKKEEYREIKPYWNVRLVDEIFKNSTAEDFLRWYNNPPTGVTLNHVINRFDAIHFRNGYSKTTPELTIECRGIKIDTGKPEWGAAPGVKYFVISLGEIINTK